jgi:hypothetical protein
MFVFQVHKLDEALAGKVSKPSVVINSLSRPKSYKPRRNADGTFHSKYRNGTRRRYPCKFCNDLTSHTDLKNHIMRVSNLTLKTMRIR